MVSTSLLVLEDPNRIPIGSPIFIHFSASRSLQTWPTSASCRHPIVLSLPPARLAAFKKATEIGFSRGWKWMTIQLPWMNMEWTWNEHGMNMGCTWDEHGSRSKIHLIMGYLDVTNHGFKVLIHSHISQYFDSKTLREFWFLVSCQDGRVVTWGNSSCGGDSSTVKDQLIEIEECLVEPQHRRWQIMTNQAVDTCSTLFSHQLFTYFTYFTSFLDMKVATPVRST